MSDPYADTDIWPEPPTTPDTGQNGTLPAEQAPQVPVEVLPTRKRAEATICSAILGLTATAGARDAVGALDEGGLLATPEHDEHVRKASTAADVERLHHGIRDAADEADRLAHLAVPCTGSSCLGCQLGRLQYRLLALLPTTTQEKP